jgi:hypothetical protein
VSWQAQAEREKAARVILGSAEEEMAQKFLRVAQTYGRNLVALQLRAMNIIYLRIDAPNFLQELQQHFRNVLQLRCHHLRGIENATASLDEPCAECRYRVGIVFHGCPLGVPRKASIRVMAPADRIIADGPAKARYRRLLPIGHP